MSKTEIKRLVGLKAAMALLLVVITACGGSDDSDSSTPDPTVSPTVVRSEVSYSVAKIGNGSSGSATAADPAVAHGGDTLSVTISQKSTITESDGKTFNCEPKAVVKVFTPKDTLYVKDFKTLLEVTERSNSQSTKTPAGNQKTLQRLQKFSVGGQEVTFDLSHDIITYVSQQQSVEMPYVRLKPAKYGAAQPTEIQTRSAAGAVAVSAIRLTPLEPMTTRGGVLTEKTPYEVSVSFTVGMERVNTTQTDAQTLSFDVRFVSVVESTTEIPDPKTTLDYELSKTGTSSTVSPFVLTSGDELSLAWQQTASYHYFSIEEKAMMMVSREPKAYVQLKAEKADTLWVQDVSELEVMTVEKPTLTQNGTAPVENTGAVKFTVAGQELALTWGYQAYPTFKVNETDVNLPYLTLSTPEIADVKVAEVPNGVLKGKKGKLYMLTITLAQELAVANASEPKGQTLQYVVKYFAGIAEEEVKLVDIKYRKDYKWYEPHDNIPLCYQFIVYKDSIFSDGSVHTTMTGSPLTSVDFGGSFFQGNGKDTIQQIVNVCSYYEEYTGKGEWVPVYYFELKTDRFDPAYHMDNKWSMKLAVPDISAVSIAHDDVFDLVATYPNQWELYDGFDINNPKVGWYISYFKKLNYVRICLNPTRGGGTLTIFNVFCMCYHSILYVEDSINGGQLITFLGDESDIDDVDYSGKINVDLTEENITMPTGEPAKVFTHTGITQMLGKEFRYQFVDTVYQYTTPPFEGEPINPGPEY